MKHEIDGEMCIDGTFHHCENCHRSFVTAIELLPNLSATVQTLEGLVEKWRKRAKRLRDRKLSEGECITGIGQWEDAAMAAGLTYAADELAAVIAALRQREKPMEESCDICEQPLGDAVAECPHCRTPFGTRIRWRQREDTTR